MAGCSKCHARLEPFEPDPCYRCTGNLARDAMARQIDEPLTERDVDELLALCDRQFTPKGTFLVQRLARQAGVLDPSHLRTVGAL